MRDECRSRREMARAGSGKDEDLAGAEEIGVAQLGISLGDAGPCGAAAQVRSGELPERIAAVDGDDWRLDARTKVGCGNDEHGEGSDMVWIGDIGI